MLLLVFGVNSLQLLSEGLGERGDKGGDTWWSLMWEVGHRLFVAQVEGGCQVVSATSSISIGTVSPPGRSGRLGQQMVVCANGGSGRAKVRGESHAINVFFFFTYSYLLRYSFFSSRCVFSIWMRGPQGLHTLARLGRRVVLATDSARYFHFLITSFLLWHHYFGFHESPKIT